MEEIATGIGLLVGGLSAGFCMAVHRRIEELPGIGQLIPHIEPGCLQQRNGDAGAAIILIARSTGRSLLSPRGS